MEKLILTVKVFKKMYEGDNRFEIETVVIPKEKLDWWTSRSGKGDFEVIEYHEKSI